MQNSRAAKLNKLEMTYVTTCNRYNNVSYYVNLIVSKRYLSLILYLNGGP